MPSPPLQTFPLSGRTLAEKYEVAHGIGGGGMGRVYLAQQRQLDRDVAIKTLRPDLATEKERRSFQKRFDYEASAAAQVTHPNAVRIFDYGTEDGIFYLVMEFLKGDTLTHIIREQGPLPALRAIHIAKQLCGVLIEAHSQSLVHRDIKPDNIMVCPRPDDPSFVKLIDFGLARPAMVPPPSDKPEEIREPDFQQMDGTPHFVAPEQIRRKSVDSRSDIYGLGATLVFMLTGTPPFGSTHHTNREVLRTQLDSDPPAIREGASLLAPSVSAMLRRAMARDRAERTASADTFLRELLFCEAELLGHVPSSTSLGWRRTMPGEGMPSAPTPPPVTLIPRPADDVVPQWATVGIRAVVVALVLLAGTAGLMGLASLLAVGGLLAGVDDPVPVPSHAPPLDLHAEARSEFVVDVPKEVSFPAPMELPEGAEAAPSLEPAVPTDAPQSGPAPAATAKPVAKPVPETVSKPIPQVPKPKSPTDQWKLSTEDEILDPFNKATDK